MITNPQAVKFCNLKARSLSDLIEQMDRTCEEFMLDVVTEFEDQTIGNAGSELIVDGSGEDGRLPVIKDNVAQIKYVVEQLRACMGIEDRRAIIAKWSTNGNPIY